MNKVLETNLIDDRSQKLWEYINQNLTVDIQLTKNTLEYGCYFINDTATIYVPKNNLDKNSFAHEMLHLKIRCKKIFLGSNLTRNIQASQNLRNIFPDELIEHITNCLDHMRMLPEYLEMGFDRKKFILDYEQDKLLDKELAELKYHYNSQREKARDIFIGKYFAAKACPNIDHNYEKNLNQLKELDTNLYIIQETLVNDWMKLDFDTDDILADSYIEASIKYIESMEAYYSQIFL